MAVRSLISDLELSRPRNRALYWTVLTVTVALFAFAFLFPLYWLFTAALKTPAEFGSNTPSLIPHHAQVSNYTNAWTQMDIAHFFLNTVYYAFGGWLIQIVVDVLAAYALSKLRPMFGKVVFGGMLASLMLPATALIVPAYLTVSDVPLVHISLLNTPWGLWLPGAANAFNIYVLKRFFDQIPNELLEAAELDGATRIQVLRRIVLPLSRPVLSVISIFSIVGIWKDFVWPLLVLPDTGRMTVSVAISSLSAQTPENVLIAALVIAAVPAIAIFFVFQRHVMAGLTAGGLKG